MVNENQSASFGIVMGLLLLVVMGGASVAFWRNAEGDSVLWERVRRLGLLAAWAFLFATVGGLSSLVGFYITPFIRSANRMSVFIAFFVLVMAGWMWQAVRRTYIRTDGHRALASALGVLALLVAVWDNADIDYFPEAERSAELYKQDAAFFAQMEAGAPRGQIYQLPFVRFPEGGLGKPDYYHFRPYLHTREMRFSFGARTGSQAESWNMQTAAMVERDPQGFVMRLKQAGFTGVLYDRAIPNRFTGLTEGALTTALGAPTVESPNREFAFFRLAN